MFDINKIMAAAENLGINIQSNVDVPGIHFSDGDGSHDIISFDEMNTFIDEFFVNNAEIKLYSNLSNDNFKLNINISRKNSTKQTPNIDGINLNIIGENSKAKLKNKEIITIKDNGSYTSFTWDPNKAA
ncbi:hypothetical protein JIN86_19610 [Lysinibacillus sp. HST-98]|uniref:hypothetical protein n=1 Tax=Lysinibacillus sp. HST-98 TaxID=2800419 RepID=UPI0019289482|nr:hypothetical protein [Lysinibacillus sp. HST-98]MBL3731781.1 hypothetical protein [Lysinibacillus sp. HST-98]